jgi:hypothetical protein
MLSKVTIAARNKHSLLSETLSQKEMLKCNDALTGHSLVNSRFVKVSG